MSKINKNLIVLFLGFLRSFFFVKKALIFVLSFYNAYRLIKKFFIGESRVRRYVFGKWGLSISFIIFFIFGFVSTIEAGSSMVETGGGLFFYSLFGEKEEFIEEIGSKEKIDVSSYLSGEAVFQSSAADGGIPIDYIAEEDVSLTAFGGMALIQPVVFVSEESVAPRTHVETYVVNSGDTISSISRKFGLNVNTILWANNLTARSLIRPGDKLSIMPVDGVLYKVKKGDTVSKIARSLNADEKKILEFNMLSSGTALTIGETLVVPGGRVVVAQPAVQQRATTVLPAAPKSNFGMIWPTSVRRITQYFSWKHPAIDIGGGSKGIGLPIYTVDDGVVEYSGWGTGYGYQIVINHGNGIKTRYAHANKLFVVKGQRVEQGDVIMEMGNTGWSTGPHLHFEIYINGARVNPLSYVR
jgi:murein DD-endopeptidase MepM/ murein hydrolase activator NlpD